jgi:hypothetical protein
MPLLLLRGGYDRRFKSIPAGIATFSYLDRYQRNVNVLLDAKSERILLRSQEISLQEVRRSGQGSVSLVSAQAV